MTKPLAYNFTSVYTWATMYLIHTRSKCHIHLPQETRTKQMTTTLPISTQAMHPMLTEVPYCYAKCLVGPDAPLNTCLHPSPTHDFVHDSQLAYHL